MTRMAVWVGALAGCMATPSPAWQQPQAVAGGGGPGAAPGATSSTPPVQAAPVAPTPPPTTAGTLAAARTFAFTPRTSKTFPGGSREAFDGPDCDGVVDAADQLGRIAVLATFFQNACYGDGGYNARDVAVEQGTVVNTDGVAYDGYRVSGPATPATNFLASHHYLFYKFPSQQDYTLYAVEQGSVAVQARIGASQIVVDGFTKLPIDVNAIGTPVTYFVAPTSERISALTALGAQADGGVLARGSIGEVALFRYIVAGTPFDTRTGFAAGPDDDANMYGHVRNYFAVRLTTSALGVMWQDTATMAINVTRIARDMAQATTTTTVGNAARDVLAAATSDGAGTIYMFLVQDGDGAATNTTRTARLVRTNLETGVIDQVALDASASGLDITSFGRSGSASLAYNDGRLGLMVGRTMHRSADGLNHQGGIAMVFDAASLTLLRDLGQTSGHSFENVLTTSSTPGTFVGIDLGDNYPRGVHLHRFTDGGNDSRVVYTFKTQHGSTSASPAGVSYPAYPEISGKTPYYKWSNDNATYTELGGVVEDAGGYTVVFAGEASTGRALDSGRVGANLNDPRNIGLVRIRRDFDQVPSYGNVIPDAVMLAPGNAETGGFYSFGGDWQPQRNTGVVWLTRNTSTAQANASRVRAVGLADGNILVLWESWTPSKYITTYGLKIDPLGKALSTRFDLGAAVRLGRRDDLWVDGNDVYAIAGRAAERALDVVRVRVP